MNILKKQHLNKLKIMNILSNKKMAGFGYKEQ